MIKFDEIISLDVEQFVHERVFNEVWNYLYDIYGGFKLLPRASEIKATIGHIWTQQKGTYTGTWPKRIGRWLKAEYNISLSAQELGVVGSIVREATVKSDTYYIDFTKKLDWSSGDFGDGGSCYWTCRTTARSMIEENDGFAIRIYEKKGDEFIGTGRAWMIPTKVNDKPLYVMWNPYGPNESLFVLLFSVYTGLSSKQISLSNNGNEDGTLWINDGEGWIFGDKEIIDKFDSYDLAIPEGIYCKECGEGVREYEIFMDDFGQVYCENCFYEIYSNCIYCQELILIEDSQSDSEGVHCCPTCFREHNFTSDFSDIVFPLEEASTIVISFENGIVRTYEVHDDEAEEFLEEYLRYRYYNTTIKNVTINGEMMKEKMEEESVVSV